MTIVDARTSHPGTASRPDEGLPDRLSGWLPAAGELMLLTVLFVLYKVGRMLADGSVKTAWDNAYEVLHIAGHPAPAERARPSGLVTQHTLVGRVREHVLRMGAFPCHRPLLGVDVPTPSGLLPSHPQRDDADHGGSHDRSHRVPAGTAQDASAGGIGRHRRPVRPRGLRRSRRPQLRQPVRRNAQLARRLGPRGGRRLGDADAQQVAVDVACPPP